MATSFTTHASGQVITAADINLIQTAVNTLENAGAASGASNYFKQAAVVCTFDRYIAVQSVGLSNQQALLTGFVSPASLTVNNVTVYVSVAAVGTTANYAAIYSVASNGDMTLLSASAASTSFMASTGKQTIALGAGVALTAGNAYAVYTYSNAATTRPTMAAAATPNVSGLSVGVTQPFALLRTGTTTSAPASTITFASCTAVSGGTPYAELS